MLTSTELRRSQKGRQNNLGSKIQKACGLIFLGIAQVKGAGNADLCAGYDFPQSYGIDDGHVIGYCFATHINAAEVTQGYWISGWTNSASLIGTANNGAFALYLDTSYTTTEKFIFNDDSAVGFGTAATCDANDTTNEAAFITLDPLAVIFHTNGGATNAYRLQQGGSTLVNYDPGNVGYNQAVVFRSETLYFGINSNTGAGDPILVSMQPDGTVNWAVDYSDGYTSSITVFTSIYKNGNTLYPITVQRPQAGTTVNVVSQIDATNGSVNVSYGEYYNTTYYIVYIFQDFVNDKYLMCNNSYSDHELEMVYYELKASNKTPRRHHYFVYYEYISGLYAGIRCGGAYFDADGDRGMVVYNKVYGGSFSKQCITYQDTVSSFDYADFQETCIDNSSLGLGEIAFTNPAWWIASDFSWNVMYWDIEIGQVLYANYATVISAIDMSQLCNDAYHVEATQTLPTSRTDDWADSYNLYYDTAGDIDPVAVTITSIATTVTIVDIIDDVQEAIQPCEVLEIDTDPTTVIQNEQTALTHTHSGFTIYLDTCYGDYTIEYDAHMRDGSAFPSWLTYDDTTRTFTVTDQSVQGTYTIDIVATTEGGLLDEENYFDLTLLPFNIAPVIVTDVVDDLECYVFEDCSQTIVVTDLDPTDSHSLICSTDIVPTNAFFDCSSGTTISINPMDNTLDPGTYIFTIVVWDDDSDATGIPLSVNSVGFTLTVLEKLDPPVELPYWSGGFEQKIYVDISQDPPPEWRPPQYGAPNITESPFENVTMMDGGKPPAWVDINRLPLILTLDPDEPTDVGKYHLNVTVTFYNYGASTETYRLSGRLIVIVTNYEPCFEKGKFKDLTMKIGESEQSKIEKWDDVQFQKPCVDLQFIFKTNKDMVLPNNEAPFITPEKSRWINIDPTEEWHAGTYDIDVYAKDYIIAERLLDKFKVTVIGYLRIAEADANFKLEPDEPPLDCYISSVTPEGVATLRFNKMMQIIEELEVFSDPYPAFDFFINPRDSAYDDYIKEQVRTGTRRGRTQGNGKEGGSDEEELEGKEEEGGRRLNMNQFHETSIPDTTTTADSLNYIKSWEILSMNNRELKFQLYFDERYVISQQPIWDKLHLDILDPRNLVSQKGEEMVEKDLANKAPPFVAIGDWKILDLLGSIMYYFIIAAIFICLPILLLTGGSTQSVWIFLSAVQLTCHLPQLGTYFPNNIERLLIDVMYVVNLKFYKFNPFLGIHKKYYEINFQGYSDNVVFSLGTLIVYYFGFMLLTLIGYQLYQRFFYAYRVPRMFLLKMSKYFIGNFFIRLMLQAFLVFNIATYMNLDNLDFSSLEGTISGIISFLFAPILFSLPFLLTWLLLNFRYDLPYLFTMHRFESAYNELRTHRTGPLMYNVIQMSRRLIMAVVIAGFRDMQAIQFQPLAFTSMMCCYFSIYYQPFLYSYLNWFDLFNEGFIAVLSYMVAAFTDYVEDEDVRYLFGEAWLCIFLANFYLSFAYVLYKTIYFSILKLSGKMPKKYWERYRYVKQKEFKPKLKHFNNEMDPDVTARSLLSEKVKIGVMKQNNEDLDTQHQEQPMAFNRQRNKKFKPRKAKIGMDETGLIGLDEALGKKDKKDKKEKKEKKEKKKKLTDKRQSIVGLGNAPSHSISTVNSITNQSPRGKRKSLAAPIGLSLVKRLKKQGTSKLDDDDLMKNNFLAPSAKKTDNPDENQSDQGLKKQFSPLSPANNDKKALLAGVASENPVEEKKKKIGPPKDYRKRVSGFFKQEITNQLQKK